MSSATHRLFTSLQKALIVGCLLGPAFVSCSSTDGAAELTGNKNASTDALTSSSKFSPNANSGLCMQPQNKSMNNGTPLVMASCDGSNEQAWVYTQGQLRLGDNKCADATDGVNRDGTKMQLWDCFQGNTNQQWTQNGKTFVWAGKNKCIDLTDGAANAGTVLQVWSCSGGDNQQWSFSSVGGSGNSGTPGDAVSNNAQGGSSGNSNSNSNSSSGGSTSTPGNTNLSGGFSGGYVHASGSNVVDGSGNVIRLRGTNIGGWLVTENWMCGIDDASDNGGTSSGNSNMRFARDTLERRFGEAKALELMNVWYDNFITGNDLDNIKNLGMNVIRVPFGWRNLQHPDGSWVTDSSGNIDFRRFDWIVSEANKRNIYVIFDFHIWRYQRQNYWTISRTQQGGQAQQMEAANIWTEVAKHFKGNTTIAAFDIINEAEGSGDNQLFKTLYSAIRNVDDKRMIVVESVHALPRNLGWDNVMYDTHLYSMMGGDFGQNQSNWNNYYNGDIKEYKGYNIPVYVGEFMAQDNNPTLSFLLGQLNNNGLNWTSWAYKTFNQGSWGLYNYGGNRTDVLNDSFDTIKSKWSNMGTANPQTGLINAMKSALGR